MKNVRLQYNCEIILSFGSLTDSSFVRYELETQRSDIWQALRQYHPRLDGVLGEIRLDSTLQNPSELTTVRRACSPPNKAAFFSPCTLLIEEISFYFIYGLDVKGGFRLRPTSIFLFQISDLNHIFCVAICPSKLIYISIYIYLA